MSLIIRSLRVKQCPACREWLSLHDLAAARETQPIGLNTESTDRTLHGMLFLHDTPGCLSSFLVELKALAPLLASEASLPAGKIPTECDRRCLNTRQHRPCQLRCRYAPYHRLMLEILRHRLARSAGGCSPRQTAGAINPALQES